MLKDLVHIMKCWLSDIFIKNGLKLPRISSGLLMKTTIWYPENSVLFVLWIGVVLPGYMKHAGRKSRNVLIFETTHINCIYTYFVWTFIYDVVSHLRSSSMLYHHILYCPLVFVSFLKTYYHLRCNLVVDRTMVIQNFLVWVMF